jgi:hypothetical protein
MKRYKLNQFCDLKTLDKEEVYFLSRYQTIYKLEKNKPNMEKFRSFNIYKYIYKLDNHGQTKQQVWSPLHLNTNENIILAALIINDCKPISKREVFVRML